jgi:hypothetical protein
VPDAREFPALLPDGLPNMPLHPFFDCVAWTGRAETLVQSHLMVDEYCFGGYHNDDSSAKLMAATSTTLAVIDAVLRLLHLRGSCSSGPAPHLLSDLIKSKSLAHVIGDDAACVLHALIGPPDSLNIRNILWHGFMSPNEFPLPIAVVVDLVLPSLQGHVTRGDLGWDHLKCMTRFQERLLAAGAPQLGHWEASRASRLIEESPFVHPAMRSQWYTALQLCASTELSMHGISLLLPALETSLRMVCDAAGVPRWLSCV